MGKKELKLTLKSFDSAQHSKLYILRLKNGRVSTVKENVLEELATMVTMVCLPEYYCNKLQRFPPHLVIFAGQSR